MSMLRSPRNELKLRSGAMNVSVSEQILLQIGIRMALFDSANVLSLTGEIDLHVSPDVEQSLASIISRRPMHVLVDLSGVTFIDSSGLAVLIHALQNVQEYGGRLLLSGINEDVRTILKMARLDQVFLIDPRDDGLLAH
jgi:anti-sigma B factor antagonist